MMSGERLIRFAKRVIEHPHLRALVFATIGLSLVGMPTQWLGLLLISTFTLRAGARRGLQLLIWGLLGLVPGYFIHANAFYLYGIVLTNVVGAWALPALLLRFKTWSRAVEIGGLVAVLTIGLAHLFHPHIGTWWGMQLTDVFTNLGVPHQALPEIIDTITQFMSGLAATFVLLMLFGNLLAARWVEYRLYAPDKMVTAELMPFRTSPLIGGLFILAAIGVYFKLPVATDVVPVIIFLFMLAGLAVVHKVVSDLKWKWVILVGLYGALLPFSTYVIGILMMIGFIDTWYNLRQQQRGKRNASDIN